MPEKISEELRALFIKVFIPALVAISIRIAVVSREKKVTIAQVVISLVCGLGFAYLFGDFVIDNCPEKWHSIIIASIAISGEKIGYWVIYKLNVDVILMDWIQFVIDRYKK